MKKISFRAIIVNSYFDGNDLTNPIKDFVDDRLSDYPIDGIAKNIFVYVKQNSVELQDTIYRYTTDGYERTFNAFETIQYTSYSDPEVLLDVGFFKDPKSTIYNRQVFSWLD